MQDSNAKEKSGIKNGGKLYPLRWGVRSLMENSILNTILFFWNTSLINCKNQVYRKHAYKNISCSGEIDINFLES